jgi:pyrimidine operon attenuation protein/uracil phosphoribosyltransferase
MPRKPSIVLDARALDRTLRRMADQIVELNAGTDNLVLVGIQRRGVQLAERIVRMIKAQEGVDIASGALDITLYRDDLQTVGPRPVVGTTHLPWTLDDQHVVIVDDVLYTGRTVRAALDELADFGSPARIALTTSAGVIPASAALRWSTRTRSRGALSSIESSMPTMPRSSPKAARTPFASSCRPGSSGP